VRSALCFIFFPLWTRLDALSWVPASARALLLSPSTPSTLSSLGLVCGRAVVALIHPRCHSLIIVPLWTCLCALRWVPASAPTHLVSLSTLSPVDTLGSFLLATHVRSRRGGSNQPTLPFFHFRARRMTRHHGILSY
jgi:hypothetical protein